MIKPTLLLCYGTPLTLAEKHEIIGWYVIGLIFIFPMMHIPPHLRDQYLAPKFDDNVEEVKDAIDLDDFYSVFEEMGGIILSIISSI